MVKLAIDADIVDVPAAIDLMKKDLVQISTAIEEDDLKRIEFPSIDQLTKQLIKINEILAHAEEKAAMRDEANQLLRLYLFLLWQHQEEIFSDDQRQIFVATFHEISSRIGFIPRLTAPIVLPEAEFLPPAFDGSKKDWAVQPCTNAKRGTAKSRNELMFLCNADKKNSSRVALSEAAVAVEYRYLDVTKGSKKERFYLNYTDLDYYVFGLLHADHIVACTDLIQRAEEMVLAMNYDKKFRIEMMEKYKEEGYFIVQKEDTEGIKDRWVVGSYWLYLALYNSIENLWFLLASHNVGGEESKGVLSPIQWLNSFDLGILYLSHLKGEKKIIDSTDILYSVVDSEKRTRISLKQDFIDWVELNHRKQIKTLKEVQWLKEDLRRTVQTSIDAILSQAKKDSASESTTQVELARMLRHQREVLPFLSLLLARPASSMAAIASASVEEDDELEAFEKFFLDAGMTSAFETTASKKLKQFTADNGYEFKAILGDGNCFFAAIAFLLNNRDGTHLTAAEIRANAITYLEHDPALDQGFGPATELGTLENYIQAMGKDRAWAVGPIIDATVLRYDISVTIVDFRSNGDMYPISINERPEIQPFILMRTGEDEKMQHYSVCFTPQKTLQHDDDEQVMHLPRSHSFSSASSEDGSQRRMVVDKAMEHARQDSAFGFLSESLFKLAKKHKKFGRLETGVEAAEAQAELAFNCLEAVQEAKRKDTTIIVEKAQKAAEEAQKQLQLVLSIAATIEESIDLRKREQMERAENEKKSQKEILSVLEATKIQETEQMKVLHSLEQIKLILQTLPEGEELSEKKELIQQQVEEVSTNIRKTQKVYEAALEQFQQTIQLTEQKISKEEKSVEEVMEQEKREIRSLVTRVGEAAELAISSASKVKQTAEEKVTVGPSRRVQRDGASAVAACEMQQRKARSSKRRGSPAEKRQDDQAKEDDSRKRRKGKC